MATVGTNINYSSERTFDFIEEMISKYGASNNTLGQLVKKSVDETQALSMKLGQVVALDSSDVSVLIDMSQAPIKIEYIDDRLRSELAVGDKVLLADVSRRWVLLSRYGALS